MLSYKETKCKLTDFNIFLYKLGVPFCNVQINVTIS